MENYKQIFDRNIDRVNSLCKLYNTLKTEETKEGKEYKLTDILRSAVVMLHSSFEEYYRSVLSEVLPQTCAENDLKNISFLGSEGKHKEKISLGELLAFKGKSVEDLIKESITESLASTSFNNFSDIMSWSRKANIDLSLFTEQDKLEKLISRRHKIVHEADNSRSDGGYGLAPIKEITVREWIATVCNLVKVIHTQVIANFSQTQPGEN